MFFCPLSIAHDDKKRKFRESDVQRLTKLTYLLRL